MSGRVTISLSCEDLASGSEEERATFGLFAITANDRLLTEGVDVDRNEVRQGPHVAGYPLAEWVVWNWWRIRWESGRPADEGASRRWDFAHRLSTVGEGYAWPNVTIFSDGLQSFLISEASRNPESVLFRYLGASQRRETVPARNLEDAMDGYVEDILTRLEGRKLRSTNLHHLWNDLREERDTPELARFRRLEAQLGYDPDEADEHAIHRHLEDATRLGEEALGEVAADAALHGFDTGDLMSADTLSDIAMRNGFDADPKDAVTLADAVDLPRSGEIEAWRLGERAARAIRDQEDLDGSPISDARLASLAGTNTEAVSDTTKRSESMAFALDRERGATRISFRSKWETGRRFELARLIGDRLLCSQVLQSADRLFPATRAYSYRQKMQRAFAAELLSPFASVDDMLRGDYSEEKQNDVAEHFKASPMTIRTQLVNHRRIDRDDAPDILSHGPWS